MRFIVPALLLTACSSVDIVPTPASDPNTVSVLGDKIDNTEKKAAAAVTVIVEQADKPDVVKAEGKVALAYLPRPDDTDVEQARQRASSHDQAAYADQVAKAKKQQADVDALWDKMEQDNKRSAEEIKALRGENVLLKNDIKRVKEEASKSTWSITGAALMVMGGFACAFLSVRIGIILCSVAGLAGAVPFIIDSPYFPWISGCTLVAIAALAIWWLYDKVKHSVNEDGNSTKQS